MHMQVAKIERCARSARDSRPRVEPPLDGSEMGTENRAANRRAFRFLCGTNFEG